jgi:hypothetical protein
VWITWTSGCDRPLRIFIIVNLAWATIQLPLVSYEHLHRVRTFPEESSDIPMRPMGRSSTPVVDQIISPHRENTAMALISPWLNRFKRLLDLFATCWFIVGNYWLFTSRFCSVFTRLTLLKKPLYFLSLVYIIIGYIVLLIPIILCTSVVFCLVFNLSLIISLVYW